MACGGALPRSSERASPRRDAQRSCARAASLRDGLSRRALFHGAVPSFAALALSCAASPAPQDGPRPDVSALFAAAAPPGDAPAATTATAVTTPEPACRIDGDCGYDPVGRRCGTDPRFNKQPPLVDQGIVCYCDPAAQSCALLRVDPAPCEGDTSCAVRMEPRPHPVRAGAGHPYRKPQACRRAKPGGARRTLHHATCERTNICTMHTRECGEP